MALVRLEAMVLSRTGDGWTLKGYRDARSMIAIEPEFIAVAETVETLLEKVRVWATFLDAGSSEDVSKVAAHKR